MLSSQWVPRLLTNDRKKHSIEVTLSFLMSYHREGQSLLDRTIMGDETYIYYTTRKTK